MTEVNWKVQFRSCDAFWADENRHIKDYRTVTVPWNHHLTERVTADEEDARAQFNVLSEWERTGSQPVKEVRLFKRTPPEWEETV